MIGFLSTSLIVVLKSVTLKLGLTYCVFFLMHWLPLTQHVVFFLICCVSPTQLLSCLLDALRLRHMCLLDALCVTYTRFIPSFVHHAIRAQQHSIRSPEGVCQCCDICVAAEQSVSFSQRGWTSTLSSALVLCERFTHRRERNGDLSAWCRWLFLILLASGPSKEGRSRPREEMKKTIKWINK